MKRKEEEMQTIALMISEYCKRKHRNGEIGLCKECAVLLQYCNERIDRCPLGERKVSCRKCTVHCYAPEQKQAIKEVMRYIGPKMIFISPISAIRHLIREIRK